MRLVGTIKARKSGNFTPEGERDAIPWALVTVVDDDSRELVKVKPQSDELPEFMDWMDSVTKGDRVELTVTADAHGNIRLVLPDAD